VELGGGRVSDWTWEYVPDAVAVRRIGTPFDVQEAFSNLKTG
jgi:hypothetical protein